MTDQEKGEAAPLIPIAAQEELEETSCRRCTISCEKRGNVLICCRTPNGQPQCVIGPHWPYMVITYIVIGAVSAGVYYFLMTNDCKLEFSVFGLCLTALVLISLTLLAFMDPGVVQGHTVREGKSASEMWSYCERCKTYRPPRTIHCNECQVCIEQYDHHCPYTGKCVGKGNIRYFNVFITALIFLLIYDITLAVVVCLEGENL